MSSDQVRRVVTRHVDVAQVPACAVRARHQVGAPGRECVHHDDRVRRADRRPVASLHAACTDLLDLGRAQAARGLDRIDELGLVHVVVATDDRHDEPPVARDEERRLRGSTRRDVEERRERIDRRGIRRLDLLDGEGLLRRGLRGDRRCDLAVRRVAARLAQHEDVLARGVEHHELVREGAAHHPDVGADGNGLEAQALEDPRVGTVVGPVRRVEAGLVAIAGVAVLHDELAHAHQAAARPGLVTELRLEVVHDERQLAVAPDDVAQQVCDDLLVRHREDHVTVGAVLEPRHLGADRVIPAGLPPQVRGMHDRHLHLLAADRVQLLADHLLDPLVDAEPQRQQRVDPGAQLAHVARPQQQAVGRHLRFRGVVAERGEEQVAQAHGAKDTGRGHRSGGTCSRRHRAASPAWRVIGAVERTSGPLGGRFRSSEERHDTDRSPGGTFRRCGAGMALWASGEGDGPGRGRGAGARARGRQVLTMSARSTPPATTLATWPAALAPIACISG